MSIRTLQARQDLGDASTNFWLAKRDHKPAEEIAYLQRTMNLRKSIFESLSRIEPITAADKLPTRKDSPDKARIRAIGRELMAKSRRQLRGKVEFSGPIY